MAGRRSTLVLGAIVAAGLALASLGVPRCSGPGLGGSGTPQEPKAEAPPEPEPNAALKIVVEGERCALEAEPAAPCAEVCTRATSRAPQSVVLDGAAGAHGVVEELRTCLSDGGLTVRMLGS